MTSKFNWNHKSDHAFGQSHVADRLPHHEALLNRPIKRAFASAEVAHREEVALEQSRNPHLLANRHA